MTPDISPGALPTPGQKRQNVLEGETQGLEHSQVLGWAGGNVPS